MTQTQERESAGTQPTGSIELHSIDVIPLRERHGTLRSLGAVWFVANINLTAMATGIVALAAGGTIFWTLVAIVVWSLFGTIFMAFHSTQGPHLGLPQLVQSRPQFGYVGAALTVFVVVLVNYVAYNTSDALLSSDAAHTLFHIPLWLGYLLAASIAALIAIFGYDMIHKVNRLLTIPTIVIMLLITVGAITLHKVNTKAFTPGEFRLAPFMTTLALIGGFQLGWAPYVSDYSRYLPANVGTRSSFMWTFWPSAVSGIWVFGIGAVCQFATGAATPVEAFKAAGDALFTGGGTVVVAGLLLGLLAVMAINQYGGSLTMLSIADSIRPIKITRAARIGTILLMGVLVYGIAQFVGEARFNDFYGSALIYLAYAFTPWTAINLIDYFFVRRGVYAISEIFNPRGLYGRWGWRGNVAYLATILIMIPFMVNAPHFVGFLAAKMNDVDYSIFVGLIVAAVLYWALTRSLDVSAERRLAAQDPTYRPTDLRTGALPEDPELTPVRVVRP
jgi:purine-cytosine permease-like protein